MSDMCFASAWETRKSMEFPVVITETTVYICGDLAGGQAALQFPLNAVVENANLRVPALGVGSELEDRGAHSLPFSS